MPNRSRQFFEYFVSFQKKLGTARKDFCGSWFGFACCARLNLQEKGNIWFLWNSWQKLPSLTTHDCRPCNRWLPAQEVDLFFWVCEREKKNLVSNFRESSCVSGGDRQGVAASCQPVDQSQLSSLVTYQWERKGQIWYKAVVIYKYFFPFLISVVLLLDLS